MPNHTNPKMNKKGLFLCPACEHAPALSSGFPRNYKWKTLRGYENHFCVTESVEKAAIEAEKAEVRQQELNKGLEERIATCPHKVGDAVFAVVHRVTKPCYETNRWGRSVRVRYEEERRYVGIEGTITAITLHGFKVNHYEVHESDFRSSLKEAEEAARAAQAGYDEACKFARDCR